VPESRRIAIPVLVASLTAAGCGGGNALPLPNDGALAFDGRGGYAALGTIGTGHPLGLAGSTFTISAWFVQEPGGDPYQRIIDKSDERLGRNGWALGADPGSGQVHLYAHDGARGADFCSARGAITPGVWHHVAAVARSDRYELWIDGHRDEKAFFEEGRHVLPGDGTARASIGNWNHAPGRAWRGRLDEVAVWATGLDAAEIAELHETRGTLDLGGRGRDYRSARHLVGWWRMEPAGDGETHDAVSDASRFRTDGRLEPGDGGGDRPAVVPRGP